MDDLVEGLLESPHWVIITFVAVYTLSLILVSWKASEWYRRLTGWGKQRSFEKKLKEKISRLEKENNDLRSELAQSSSTPANNLKSEDSD